MATFTTSAIIELIDKTRAGANSALRNFGRLEKAADGFGDEADKAAEKATLSLEEFTFEQRKAQTRLAQLRNDLRNGKGDFKQISNEIDNTTEALEKLNSENREFARQQDRQERRQNRRRNIGRGLAAAGIVGTALVGAGVGAFNLTNTFAEQAVEAGRLAESTGFAVESLTALRFAFKQTVSDEAVNALPAIIRDLTARVGELRRTGGGELSSLDKGLQRILLSAKNSEDAFVRVGREIRARNLDTQTLSSTLEKLFGEPGRQLVPFFRKSQVEIDALINQARDFGIVLTAENVDSAEKFLSTWNSTKARFQGIGLQIGAALADPIRDFLDSDFVQGSIDKLLEFVNDLDSSDIESAFQSVADNLQRAAEAVGFIFDAIITTQAERRQELESLSNEQLRDRFTNRSSTRSLLLGEVEQSDVRLAREILGERSQRANVLAETRNVENLFQEEASGLGSANADTSEITRLLGELVSLTREGGGLNLNGEALAQTGASSGPVNVWDSIPTDRGSEREFDR